MNRPIRSYVFVLMVAAVLAPAAVLAQTTTATILGEVRDDTGGVLPGATVTITNVETGVTRPVTTGENGLYRASNLPVGLYKVTAELVGFKTTTRAGITLVIGQEAIINLSLGVGEIAEEVVVSGEAPMIDSTSAVLGGLVDQKAIQDLPLNGRSFIELATLRSGATLAQYGATNESQGFGKKISITGSRFTSNLFLLDGTVMNDSFNSAGNAAGGALTGVETVREFKVVTNAYSAEYGQHTGGVINAVTKSGTNQLHGSIYEFHRNDNLDARNFFDPGEAPEFKRNQFGVATGGPILRDRAFFFVNYEGLREGLGRTELLRVPSLDARRGFLPNANGQLQFIGVSPNVAPYIDAIWPLPNSIDFGNGVAEFIRPVNERSNQNFVTARVDYVLSPKDTIFSRYTIDDADRQAPESINVESHLISRNQYATVEWNRVFTSNLLNAFNVGFTRTRTGKQGFSMPGFDRVTFSDSEFGHGVIGVAGLTGSGSGNLDPRIFLLNNYQLKNDVTYTRGNHTLKFGGSVGRLQHNDTSPRQPAGAYTFENLEDFLRGRAREALISLAENFHRYVRQTLMGVYLQEDWRLRSNLTLNAGVRWEHVTTPKEIRGNNPIGIGGDEFFDPTVTPADIVLGDSVFETTPMANFAPRVGVAWDPFGDSKTSVRGGVGIFHEPLLYWTYRMALLHTAPIFIEGRLVNDFVNIDFPNAYFTQRELFVGNPRYESVDPTPDQPRVAKFSVEVQRSLSTTTALKIGYSGSQGRNLGRSTEINGRRHTLLPDGTLFFANGAPVYNPNFGRARHRTFEGISDYHSLRLDFDKRFSGGLQFSAGYTFSKNTDDGAAITGSTDFSNENGPSRHFLVSDHALSPLDVRHSFTFNFVYELPDFQSMGWANPILGGWRLNGLVRMASGTPFSVDTGFDRQRSIQGTQYPNLVPGADKNPVDPGNNQQYYDPTAFELQPAGFLGNLGRNTLVSPGLATVDFSVAKMINLSKISDDFRMEFRGEFFNLANRANFGLPVRTVFDSRTLAARPDAGLITSTTTTSRQIQLGIKLLF